MQVKKTVCDRCGKEINDNWNLKDLTARINFWNISVSRSSVGQKFDLCPECCEKFIRFMESDEK